MMRSTYSPDDNNHFGAVEIMPGVAVSGLGPSYLLLHQNVIQQNQTWWAEETSF